MMEFNLSLISVRFIHASVLVSLPLGQVKTPAFGSTSLVNSRQGLTVAMQSPPAGCPVTTTNQKRHFARTHPHGQQVLPHHSANFRILPPLALGPARWFECLLLPGARWGNEGWGKTAETVDCLVLVFPEGGTFTRKEMGHLLHF